jgi:tousled-like kinase
MINEGRIKIIDFGLCKLYETNESRIELTSQGTGTYWYLPPETFEFDRPTKISNTVDIWSTGVIFFELLYGRRPFGHGMTQSTIINENIISKAHSIPLLNSPKGYSISGQASGFIKQCLEHDQEKRISVKDAYFHAYLRKPENVRSFQE